MAIFNYLNSFIFYSLLIVTVGFIGFSVCYTTNNVNDNVTDGNVNTSSNNVNSDAGTQTEEPRSIPGPSHWHAYPYHEAKYLELLKILGSAMHEKRIDNLCLRHMVYSYTLEQINSSDINHIIISRLSKRLRFF